MVDIEAHNRRAWDQQVRDGNRWTLPVSTEAVSRARSGIVELLLTPERLVPRDWYGAIEGCDCLCLASGGGQQAPILAAAGARVTVLDNSPAQLDQDRKVANREGLDLRLELGLMADLSRFRDESFDLIFHPVSNVFAPEVRPVWREAHRVLRPGGRLLAGFVNPWWYVFDSDAQDRGELVLAHSIPWSNVGDLSEAALAERIERGEPLEFAHTLEDQIGGQVEAGFAITGFYEDRDSTSPAARHAPMFIATRAERRA